MKKKKINTKTFREEFFGAIIGFALFFLIWYLLTTYTPLKRMLPGPIPVLSLFFHFCVNKIGRYYTMPMHALISLKRILIGYTAGTEDGVTRAIEAADGISCFCKTSETEDGALASAVALGTATMISLELKGSSVEAADAAMDALVGALSAAAEGLSA